MASVIECEIRRFEPADLSAVVALIEKTIRTSYADCYAPSARQYFLNCHTAEAILNDAASGLVLVALHGGAIIGTATLVGSEISRAYIAPEYRCRGVGGQLARSLEECAREHHVPRLELYASIPAKTFYESLGYSCVNEGSLPMPDGEGLYYYRMAKDLEVR